MALRSRLPGEAGSSRFPGGHATCKQLVQPFTAGRPIMKEPAGASHVSEITLARRVFCIGGGRLWAWCDPASRTERSL